MVAWEVAEEDHEHPDHPASRARSASDFCVKYEYLRCQRKASDDEKVTPLPSPHPVVEEDHAFGLQEECHTPSPPAHGGGFRFDEDGFDAATPEHHGAGYEQDCVPAPLQADSWSGNAFFQPYQGFPGVAWMPAAPDQQQAMPCHPNMQYLSPPQTIASAPMLYYYVGFVAPEGGEPAMQMPPAAEIAAPDSRSSGGGYAPETMTWGASERQGPSQSSQRRSVRSQREPQPKVLEAGEVRRDVDSQGSAEAAPAIKDEERTTIMLRNIPKDTTRETLMELLDRLGFAKMYDFLYLPRDFKDNFAIYGYAFVNFVNHEQASKARELFDGFVGWRTSETQTAPCEAHWGHPLQGYAAHVERYRNSPVMSSQVPDMCRPLVFQDGLPVSFPAPTKPIRLPRRKGWILAGRRPDQLRETRGPA